MCDLSLKISNHIGYGMYNPTKDGITIDPNGKSIIIRCSDRERYTGPQLDSGDEGNYLITISKLSDYYTKETYQPSVSLPYLDTQNLI
jgi:hypothetical protein